MTDTSISLSIYIYFDLSVCLSVYLPVCLSIYIFVCLSVCLSLSVSLSALSQSALVIALDLLKKGLRVGAPSYESTLTGRLKVMGCGEESIKALLLMSAWLQVHAGLLVLCLFVFACPHI
jgi:hypothetical protein